jgi:Tol biopolymer transport system component
MVKVHQSNRLEGKIMMKKYGLPFIVGIVLLVGVQLYRSLALNAPQAVAAPSSTLLVAGFERISVNSPGNEAKGASSYPAISSDGCLIAFSSNANNLVDNDTNGSLDVFIRNRCSTPNSTERVSVRSDEQQANGSSWEPVISPNGHYVAFSSSATNLVTGDTNGVTDVFVRDRQTGMTIRVSKHSNGQQGNKLSLHPSISDDGQIIAFVSESTNLVSGDTNGVKDIFVHNRTNNVNTTIRVSVGPSGLQANGLSDNPAISGNGLYIAFESMANNLVNDETDNRPDVFVHDRQTSTTEKVSVTLDGESGNRESYDAAISADGRYVVFESWATNLLANNTNGNKHIFVRDRTAGVTEHVSIADETTGPNPGEEANNDNGDPAIVVVNSCPLIVFESWAGNLDPRPGAPEDLEDPVSDGDSDIFLRNECTGTTERVTLQLDNSFGREDSFDPAISANGLFVAFISRTQDLISGDTNGEVDIFIWNDGTP